MTSFTHTDRLGSMKGLSASGAVTDTANYDAFGMVVSRTGTSSTQKGFASGFGYQEDGESGYKLLGHRYYDPETGRFLSRDPAFSGRNWFAYCGNNPLKYADPEGESWRVIGGIIGGIVGSVAGGMTTAGCGAWVGGAAGNALGAYIGSWLDGDDAEQAALNGAEDGLISLLLGAAIEKVAPYASSVLGRILNGAATEACEIGAPQVARVAAEDVAVIVETDAQKYARLVEEAEAKYPNKAGKFEKHHEHPKYLGGDKNGKLVSIPAAYHQLITNEFRSLAPYGKKPIRSAADIMKDVYKKYPLPFKAR